MSIALRVLTVVCLFVPVSAAGEPFRHTVAGRVVDEAGRPVAGVRVGYLTRPEPLTTTTAADGRFTLRPTEREAHAMALHATADDGARQGWLAVPKYGADRQRTVFDGLVLTLRPARPTTVLVKDAAGAPVAGAAVEASDRSYGSLPRSTTDASGTATLRLPADASIRLIVAHKDGVGYDYFTNADAFPTPVRSGPPPEEVTLTLDGARTVRTRLVDAVTGEPLVGVPVEPWYFSKPGRTDLGNLGGLTSLRRITDADGVATFAMVPTRLEQPVVFWPRAPYSSPERLVFDPAEHPDGVAPTATLLPKAVVAGTVRKADGTPVPGVLVRVEGGRERLAGLPTMDLHDRQDARTDSEGAFAVTVNPELLYLAGVADHRFAAETADLGLVDADVEDVRLVLTEGTLLHGRVRGESKAPATDVTVLVSESPTGFVDGLSQPSLTRWLAIDEQGRYARRLGRGDYRISPMSQLGDQSITATLTGRGDQAFDFVVPVAEDRVVAGVVRHAGSGAPAADMLLKAGDLRPRSSRWGFNARTDAEGRFAARFPAAPLEFLITGADGKAGAVVVVEDAARGYDLTVHPLGVVTGKLIERDGRPVADAAVRLYRNIGTSDSSFDARHLTDTTTGADGAFRFGDVLVGARYVLVLPRGGDDLDFTRARVQLTPDTPAVDLGTVYRD